MRSFDVLGRLRLWKAAVSQRVGSVPGWVIVLSTAAVVGSISAVVAVTGLARWKNRSTSAVEVPVREVGDSGE